MDSLRLILLIIGLLVIAGIYFWETRGGRRRRDAPIDDDLDTSYLDEIGESRGRKDFGYTRTGEAPSIGDEAALDELADRTPPYHDDFEHDPIEGTTIGLDTPDEHESALDEESAPRVSTAEQIPMPLEDETESAIESLQRIIPRPLTDDLDDEVPADEEMLVALTIMATPGETFSGTNVSQVLARLGFEFGDGELFHHFGQGNAAESEPVYSIANVINPGVFDPDQLAELETPGLAMFARLIARDPVIDIFESMLEAGDAIASALDGELCDQSRNPLSRQSVNHLREEVVEFTRKHRTRH